MSSYVQKVAVIGLGYVGLPLAIHLAKSGLTVCGVDTDKLHLSSLRSMHDAKGLLPASELPVLGTIDLRDTPPDDAQAYIICVPTPHNDGLPDQSHVEAALRSVGKVLPDDAWVIVESTVMPGSSKNVFQPILVSTKGDDKFNMAYSPERIDPGPKSFDAMKAETKLIGTACTGRMHLATMYSRVFNDVVFVDSMEAAELAKCFENTQRDANIALMNELSIQCRIHDLPYDEVVRGLATKASSPKFTSGLVGGHCIAVDPYYLHAYYDNKSLAIHGRRLNEAYVDSLVEYIARGGYRKTLILGRTYKALVRDTRNSGSMALYNRLQAHGTNVRIHDPLLDGLYTGSGKFELIVGTVNHDPDMNLLETYKSGSDCEFMNVGKRFAPPQTEGFSRIIHV